MQISSFEITQGLERRMSIDIAAEEIETQVAQRLKEISKTSKIDGFRPGKVPMSMVVKRFKPSVRAEIIDSAINTSLRKAFETKEVKPVGRPSVEINRDQDGEALAFTVTFEVYPSVPSVNADEFQVERPVADITDADIDKVIESWRKMKATWELVDRASQKEDKVIIDYDCYLNGEKVEEGSGQEAEIRLGQQAMVPGFEEGLLNQVAGAKTTINVTLPAQHPVAKLSGQAVELHVTVKKVEGPVLPVVDEAFIQSFGDKEATLEKLRENIKQSLKSQADGVVRTVLKETIFQQLLDKLEVEIPQVMLNGEIQMIKSRQAHTHDHDHDHEHGEHCDHDHSADDADIRKQAEDSVKLGLIVGQYVNDHQITYDQQAVFNAVKEIAMQYKDPQSVAQNILKNDQMMQRIIASVLEEQAVDKLIEAVQKTDVLKSYDDIMKMSEN